MIEIVFKPEEIIGKITELQKVQIPRASEIALNQAVYAASQELKSQAGNIFNNPVPFTVNSFLYKKAEQRGEAVEAKIFIRDQAPKGNPPSKYLAPQLVGPRMSGGPHYPTRFQGALLNTVVQNARGRNVQVGQRGRIMIPNLQSPMTRTNKYGNMRPGQYSQILSALKGNISSADIYGVRRQGEAPVNDQAFSKYIYLDEESIYEPYFRRRFTHSPKPGIYFVDRVYVPERKRSENRYYRVMTESRIPTYAGKFPFADIAENTARQRFNEVFSSIILR
jgi:hypothetical protein